MTDREKVISHFQDAIEASGDGNRWRFVRVDMIEDAIVLLREQEPVRATVATDTWICSKCGHSLESQDLIDDKENPQVLVHEIYQYCPNCGRAVKWE